MKLRFLLVSTATLLLIWACGRPAVAQMSPEEHASHHAAPGATPAAPGGGQAAAAPPEAAPMTSGAGQTPSAGAGSPAAAPAAGMGAGMGEMMKGMGKPPQKELYPSLMALPDDVTPEQRAGIEQLARERIKEGTARLSSGLQKLSDSTSDEDYAAMQQATEQMREGLAEFEAAIAARRVLAEGKAPRNLALDWFKREMNLASSIDPEGPRTLLGVSPFHLFTMVLLIAFGLSMIAMYFFKMRRAAALFGRLDPDKNPPSPGAPPPSGGGRAPPGPRAPPDGAVPMSGGAPTDAQNPPAKPAIVKPAAAPPLPGESSAVPVAGGDTAKGADKPAAPPPVTANWKGQLRIGSIVTETGSLKTFHLLPSSNDRFLPFTFLPGQFLNVAFWIGGAKMNRSYSIASSPTQREYIELAIRREPRGAVSRHIDDLLKIGDQIEVGGPVGKFTFTGTEADSIVLISAGVGITPMMSITRYLSERKWPGDIFFVYTCSKPADFIFADEAAAIQRLNQKLHVAVTISRPEGTDWKGPRGRITKEWLLQVVPDLLSRRTHLCGPPAMMDSIKAIYSELGIPPDQLKTEAFGATKPAPATPDTTAAPTSAATGPLVTFSKNGKSAKIRIDLKSGDSPPKQSILELSEELGIGIEFSCRVGTCGVCKVKMTSGEVDQEVQDALDNDDKAKNIILACQAKPKSEVTVEA
ncbi:MAG: FAD-binding oxidoreductase [Acidobacteriota bacterium]|nr:FAD-binding oxidoreductase [Acidobacteriota bacterium]